MDRQFAPAYLPMLVVPLVVDQSAWSALNVPWIRLVLIRNAWIPVPVCVAKTRIVASTTTVPFALVLPVTPVIHSADVILYPVR